MTREEVRKLHFSTQKPPAHVHLDDRCICFTGEFPIIEELKAFKPWNRIEIGEIEK
jgi:hypothetical protein